MAGDREAAFPARPVRQVCPATAATSLVCDLSYIIVAQRMRARIVERPRRLIASATVTTAAAARRPDPPSARQFAPTPAFRRGSRGHASPPQRRERFSHSHPGRIAQQAHSTRHPRPRPPCNGSRGSTRCTRHHACQHQPIRILQLPLPPRSIRRSRRHVDTARMPPRRVSISPTVTLRGVHQSAGSLQRRPRIGQRRSLLQQRRHVRAQRLQRILPRRAARRTSSATMLLASPFPDRAQMGIDAGMRGSGHSSM